MDIKVEIGKKIKNARLNRGLTQADLCDDESELTIRQLARIEQGQTMVTIPKLLFLAKQLNIPVRDLVDVEKIELPKNYLILKRQLVSSLTYADPKRIAEKEAIIDEIYEKYYDNLPEEEQLIVDVTQAKFDMFASSDVNYGLAILDEYFHQILKKKRFNTNDLLVIDLYFFCCALGLENKLYFNELAEKVLLNVDYDDKDSLSMLEKIINSILIQIEPGQYLKYTKILRELIGETKHLHHKIGVYMFEAKYHILTQKDKDLGDKLYTKAITLAEFLGDDLLVSRIISEKETDFSSI